MGFPSATRMVSKMRVHWLTSTLDGPRATISIRIPLRKTSPPAIDVRPALPEHIPLIAESIAESYRGEFSGNRFRSTMVEAAGQAEWYSSPVHDLALWQVAWDGDQVVGQALPMIERSRGIIDEVSVRPAWRRMGLARALLTRALRDLQSRGVTVIRLFTNSEFPTHARDLYTNLGFRVVKEFPRYRKSSE